MLHHPITRYVFRSAMLGICYSATGLLGLWLAATAGGYAAPVWPPAGIAAAALLVWGLEYAPIVGLAAFLVNLVSHSEPTTLLVAGFIGLGNSLEAVAIVLLLKRLFNFSRDFVKLSDVLGFISASVLGPIVGATIGITAIFALRPGMSPANALAGWTTWWLGDMLGLLVVTPMLIATPPKDSKQTLKTKLFTGLTYPIVLSALFVLAFTGIVPPTTQPFFFGFLVYVGLIWCALALSMRGLFFAVGLVATVAICRATQGLGVFIGISDMVQRLSLLQLLLGCISVTMMILSSVVAEKLTAHELAHSRELALIAGEKMSALGSMTSSIAHEINNPLSVIFAKTELLRELVQSGNLDAAALGKAVDKIELTAVRIEKIVRSLVFFSRNAEHDSFQFASLKAIVEDTIEICSEHFKAKDVRLIVDPIPEHWQLECRAVQIAQVLLNLLNNAQAAASGNPDRWVRLTADCVGANLKLSVTDSGPGVPLELQQKIFHPFFTTKIAGKGTGLGLSVSKGIVEDHHGSIALDCASDHTRFVVNLPIRQGSHSPSLNSASALRYDA